MKNFIALGILGLSLIACTGPQKDIETTTATVIEPGSAKDFEQNGAQTVYFDFDSSNLTPEAQTLLAKAAEWMNLYKARNFVIEGRTDVRGTQEYNLGLGSRRAESVKSFLTSKCGVEAGRLTTISYGKESLVSAGTTEADHAINRQAHIVVAQ